LDSLKLFSGEQRQVRQEEDWNFFDLEETTTISGVLLEAPTPSGSSLARISRKAAIGGGLSVDAVEGN